MLSHTAGLRRELLLPLAIELRRRSYEWAVVSTRLMSWELESSTSTVAFDVTWISPENFYNAWEAGRYGKHTSC